MAVTDNIRMPITDSGNIRTAHSAVTNRLRTAILAGVLPAGSRLVQADLARSLSVSVTPVREALRDLIAEGLVEYSAFHGATVHEPSLAELEDVYELRTVLIPIVVREGVALITRAELEEAERLARAMERAEQPVEWIDLNRQFHKVFYAASRRRHLHDILARLADLSSLYVGLSISGDSGRRERGDLDHAEIIKAYATGDVRQATKLTVEHNEDTLDVARSLITGTTAGDGLRAPTTETPTLLAEADHD